MLGQESIQGLAANPPVRPREAVGRTGPVASFQSPISTALGRASLALTVQEPSVCRPFWKDRV